MSGSKKRDRRSPNHSDDIPTVARETGSTSAGDCPVMALFRDAAIQLNERQDKHNRLYKWSRELTAESRRIIILLHSRLPAKRSGDKLTEAKERIQRLIDEPLKSIGVELENSPAHQHSRAVTIGFQDYVKARNLLSLMSEKAIITYKEVQKELNYTIKKDGQQQHLVTVLPEMDYMLGLADLTGELMRMAVNSVSNDDIEECSRVCAIIRHLYVGYLGISSDNRILMYKLQTTRSNVQKVEMALYTLYIRARPPPPPLPTSPLSPPAQVALLAALEMKARPSPTDED